MGIGSLFPGVQRPGHGANNPPPSSAEVKERVQLYCYAPCGAFMAYSTTNITFYFTFIFAQLRLQKDLLLRISAFWVISYYGLEFRSIKVYRYTSFMQLVR
jgi:hypothetical protein